MPQTPKAGHWVNICPFCVQSQRRKRAGWGECIFLGMF
jgi:hypothetical protein